jgi:hypothetical protein
VVRADELVRGKDAAAREERREEDEVEDEEGGEAEAAGQGVAQDGSAIASSR